MKCTLVIPAIILCTATAWLDAQAPVAAPNPLHRQYREGETLVYRMTGANEDLHYSLRAEGTVNKDAAGTFYEEYRWTAVTLDGKPYTMAPATSDFRQKLSLDPNIMPSAPDLTKTDPKLIGPVLDMMTFYVDLWLAARTGQVVHPGDHFYFPMGMPGSWADGTHVLVGESSVDFDFTLKAVNPVDGTATLVVKHVPPQKPQIHFPAAWMETPVADTANNWVQLVKRPDGKFLAGAGQETLTVSLVVSLADGKILSAGMDNVVKVSERTCDDPALAQCSAPEPYQIVRKIEIALEPAKP